MKPEAVIFDYLGVLVELDSDGARAFFKGRVPISFSTIVRGWEAWCSDHLDALPSARAMWSGFWASLQQELALSAPMLEEIQSFDFIGLLRAYPDTLHALGEARRLGLRIGILSNSVLPKLESSSAALLLTRLADVVWVPSREVAGKPSREAYLDAARLLGVAPERCLFFDNEPRFVEAAREAGMRGYVMDRGPDLPPAAPGIVRDLSGLGRLVEEDT
jgi:putative hydrolase of the HAD superfamily